MKAVAYYRIRPSEPAASALALREQREAVRRTVEEDRLQLIAEFTEHEGEDGAEGCPAYVAAVRVALANKKDTNAPDVALIIVSRAAIGSGKPFEPPVIEGAQQLLYCELETPLTAASPEIELPSKAPGLLCFYADYRPRQLDTLVYLCNATPNAITAVVVAIDNISMNQFYRSEPSSRWMEVNETRKVHWDIVQPGTCIQVNSLSHFTWDEVNRYRLAFTDAEGRRWMAKANDLPLNACQLALNPDQTWVVFDPAHRADQAEPS